MPFTNRAVLCKSFHILLIINQFTPTSIFLHFQGLVAPQNSLFWQVKQTVLVSKIVYFTWFRQSYMDTNCKTKNIRTYGFRLKEEAK